MPERRAESLGGSGARKPDADNFPGQLEPTLCNPSGRTCSTLEIVAQCFDAAVDGGVTEHVEE
jgi:hypothetical protein